MATDDGALARWTTRHTRIVWLGILLNLLFALPLVFHPAWLLELFALPPGPSIWPRFAGLLLIILSAFYVPATLDIERYRLVAWLHVLPSRTFGAVFFTLAVFLFGQPYAFLIAVLLDGGIAALSLLCLIRISEREAGRAAAGAAP